MSKRLARNRRRLELMIFVESLSLHLEVGFDLRYAWEMAGDTLRAQGAELAVELALEGDSLSLTLDRLSQKCEVEEARLWFSLLRLLYQEGSPLVGAVKAFRRQLVLAIEASVRQHTEEFPQRASLFLLLFFLPPAFALLLYPLVTQWLTAGP